MRIFLNEENIEFRHAVSPNLYYEVVGCCDVGLVFLSNDLTVPNIPSRSLFYMDHSLPIISLNDSVTDFGSIVRDNGFGFSSISDDKGVISFYEYVKVLTENAEIRKKMGRNAKKYLRERWNVEKSYEIIMKHISDDVTFFMNYTRKISIGNRQFVYGDLNDKQFDYAKSFAIGENILLTGENLCVELLLEADCTCILLGEIIDCYCPEKANNEILFDIYNKSCSSMDKLLENCNIYSGRWAIIVKILEKTYVLMMQLD
jgi:hypothetical protein